MSDTQIQKLHLLEWMASLQDKSLIDELVQWKEDHQRVSVDEYDNELTQADQEIESGDFLINDEAEQKIRAWREK